MSYIRRLLKKSSISIWAFSFINQGPFQEICKTLLQIQIQIQKVIQIQIFLFRKPICITLPICKNKRVLQIQWKNDHRAAFDQNTMKLAEILSAHRPNDARSRSLIGLTKFEFFEQSVIYPVKRKWSTLLFRHRSDWRCSNFGSPSLKVLWATKVGRWNPKTMNIISVDIARRSLKRRCQTRPIDFNALSEATTVRSLFIDWYSHREWILQWLNQRQWGRKNESHWFIMIFHLMIFVHANEH